MSDDFERRNEKTMDGKIRWNVCVFRVIAQRTEKGG